MFQRYTFLRHKIIADKVVCNLIVGSHDTVGSSQRNMHPEMQKMTFEPSVLMVSVAKEAQILNFENLLSGFVHIHPHQTALTLKIALCITPSPISGA